MDDPNVGSVDTIACSYTYSYDKGINSYQIIYDLDLIQLGGGNISFIMNLEPGTYELNILENIHDKCDITLKFEGIRYENNTHFEFELL